MNGFREQLRTDERTNQRTDEPTKERQWIRTNRLKVGGSKNKPGREFGSVSNNIESAGYACGLSKIDQKIQVSLVLGTDTTNFLIRNVFFEMSVERKIMLMNPLLP